MPILFGDGFESGDISQFSGFVGNVQVIALMPFSGQFCARCETLGVGAERSYVHKDVTPARQFLYARMYIRVNQDLLNEGDRFSVIGTAWASPDGAMGSCGVVKDGGSLRWYLIKAEFIIATAGPTIGKWHCLELYQDTVTDGLILYQDGVEVLRLLNVDVANIESIRFGISYANLPYPVVVDIDRCVIADEYIGPEEAPPPPPPPCFIATAAFGTPLASEIGVLRSFRDNFLLLNRCGAGLVQFYYKTSPPFASFIQKHDQLRRITRILLKPIVRICSNNKSF